MEFVMLFDDAGKSAHLDYLNSNDKETDLCIMKFRFVVEDQTDRTAPPSQACPLVQNPPTWRLLAQDERHIFDDWSTVLESVFIRRELRKSQRFWYVNGRD